MNKKLVKNKEKNNKELVKADKKLSKRNSNGEDGKDLHRPEYQMVVKQKISTTNMLLLLAIYTVGVVFVTISFVKDSCS